MYMDQLKGLDPLRDGLSLPGWDASTTKGRDEGAVPRLRRAGRGGALEEPEHFLQEVIPVAEACGVRMAIHPDDPPYPIFGLPRIITCEKNLDRMLNIVDSPANSPDAVHGVAGLRVVQRHPAPGAQICRARPHRVYAHPQRQNFPDGSFEEAGASVLRRQPGSVRHRQGAGGQQLRRLRPSRPRPHDLGETGKPGYGLYDRGRGLSINGLFEACEKAQGGKLRANDMMKTYSIPI